MVKGDLVRIIQGSYKNDEKVYEVLNPSIWTFGVKEGNDNASFFLGCKIKLDTGEEVMVLRSNVELFIPSIDYINDK